MSGTGASMAAWFLGSFLELAITCSADAAGPRRAAAEPATVTSGVLPKSSWCDRATGIWTSASDWSKSCLV